MSMPGFTAGASLRKLKDVYALAPGLAVEAGTVQPQLFCRSDEGGTTCFQCWDEGGFSGCYSFRIPRFLPF